jgi:O-antigen ligase
VPAARDALYVMTLGKFEVGTYGERAATLGPAIQAFERQPLLGTGWGTDFSYSVATQMLANSGLIGTALFVCAIIATLVASRKARRRYAERSRTLALYAEAAENAFIVYLAESVVTGFKYVVADIWCLWALAIAIPSCLTCLRHEEWSVIEGRQAILGRFRSPAE